MRFREVIRAPFWLIAFIYFLFISLVVAVWAAIGNQPAFITWVVSTVLIVLIALKTTLVIEVAENELRAGPAHIELKYLGDATVLESDAMRLIRGRDADPANYLAIRFWSSRGIMVRVKDIRDDTPHWIISSRRGSELAASLR